MSVPGSLKGMKNVLRWCRRDEWEDPFAEWVGSFVAAACEEFDVDATTFEEDVDREIFQHFIAFAAEAFLASAHGEERRNPIDDYLKRRGFKEKPAAKRYLQALRSSRLSLYEIVDVAPGKYVVLRDLLRGGEPIRVEDESGSEAAGLWDRLVLRVVSIGSRNVMPGAVLPLRFGSAETIKDYFDEALRVAEQNRQVGLDDLIEAEPHVFTNFWLSALDDEGAVFPGRSVDDDDFDEDDEELEWEAPALSFPITGDKADVISTLDSRREFQREAEDRLVWAWSSPPPEAPTPEPASGGWTDEQDFVLGYIGMMGESLVLSPVDADAAEDGEALLKDALGNLVGPAVVNEETDIADLDSELADLLERELGPDKALDPNALIRVLMTHSLDRNMQFLDGLTPREAVAEPANAEKVVDWLKLLENADWHASGDTGAPRHDFRWIWEDLGIADRRR